MNIIIIYRGHYENGLGAESKGDSKGGIETP